MLLLVAVPACRAESSPAGGEERRTRIVLLTLDTLRYDALVPDAGGASPMPRTWRFASRGHVFERFFAAAPTTQPTHSTLFTGLHPWEHGVTRNGQVLDESFETLAERLRGAGWETEAVVASFPVHRRFGFAQGFDRYDDAFTFERKPMPDTWIGLDTEGEHFYSIAPSTTEKALAALERTQAPRQFLWIHYYDPHSPYGDLEEFPVALHRVRTLAGRGDPELAEVLERARAYYREDLARLDESLGRLFARLDADADTVDTHVLVTADHGESFGEHGAYGHDERLTPEQIHVPTFLVSPRLSSARRADVAGSADVLPTLLSLAGLPLHRSGPETAGGLPGRDLTRAPEAPEAGAGRAFGLRRYERGQGPPRFFAHHGDELVTGDAEAAFEDDRPERPLPAGETEAVRAEFEAFARCLARVSATALDDEETVRALGALGYGGEQ